MLHEYPVEYEKIFGEKIPAYEKAGLARLNSIGKEDKCMLSYKGGQTVGKGTYRRLYGRESVEVEHSAVLPGKGRFLKVSTGGMLILGPLFGLLFVCLLPLLTLIVALTLIPRLVLASVAPEESGMCLGCHSEPGMVKTFKNGEKMPLLVEEKHFRGAVHDFLACTGCHTDVSMDTHPSATFGSRREFALHMSNSCRICHADEQLKARPTHWAIAKANAPPCMNCHGSHSIRKVSELKTSKNSQYCLTCHKQNLTVSIGGESLSLSVEERELRKSVHSGHDCTDCHVEFSGRNHPVKKFNSRRELSIAISDACKNCHPDEYKQYEGSIHFRMLKEGDLSAPVCTDCHGSHSVGPKSVMETVEGTPCRKCHQEIFAAYSGSVHGVAKLNGMNKAPLCSSCHFAHEVKPALVSLSSNGNCKGCHDGVVGTHDRWLQNAAAHLDAVACPACHVPNAERAVFIRIVDGNSGETVSGPMVKEALASAGTGVIESRQLWDIYRKLNTKAKTAFKGSLALKDNKHVHALVSKNKAVKQCEQCHSTDSDFFGTVLLAVITEEGKEDLYKVNPQAHSSIFSLLPLNQFYVLSGTRLKLLDLLGVLMVLGGASFPAFHITMRILTRGIRERREK